MAVAFGYVCEMKLQTAKALRVSSEDHDMEAWFKEVRQERRDCPPYRFAFAWF